MACEMTENGKIAGNDRGRQMPQGLRAFSCLVLNFRIYQRLIFVGMNNICYF